MTDKKQLTTCECKNLTQKEYKTRHGLVGKLILRGFWKWLQSDNDNKWYVHKPESVKQMRRIKTIRNEYLTAKLQKASASE